MKVLLHEMSWKEAKQYFAKNDTAILPVGSNEQHDPQNPLGTDHLIAKAIAEETAKRTGVLCLQVIPFGASLTISSCGEQCTFLPKLSRST